MQNLIELGKILKDARTKQGLELEDVSKRLKIRRDYIKAIEAGTIANDLPCVYFLGYIKNYSQLLGLNSRKMLAMAKQVNVVSEFEKIVPKEEEEVKSNVSFSTEPSLRLVAASILFLFFISMFLGNLPNHFTYNAGSKDVFSSKYIKEIGARSIKTVSAKDMSWRKKKVTEEL